MKRLAALAGLLISTTLAAQSWRVRAIASFDDVWTTVSETFYDPTFGGVDWPGVRRELRPRVEAAESLDAARGAIREMLARLGRSHLQLLSASSAEALPGPAAVQADIRAIAEGVFVSRVRDDAATKAGLSAGDEVLAIDGRAVRDEVADVDTTDVRATRVEIWRRVNRLLHGDDGSTAALRVRKPNGSEKLLTVPRSLGRGDVVTFGNLPPLRVEFDAREALTPGGRRVGVIAFNFWMTGVSDPLAGAIDRYRAHDGMILDLRGNPGGLAAMISGVAGHVIAEPVVLGTMHTRQNPLSFKVNPRLVTADGRRVDVFRGPLAILVDELTGSTSEVFAAALQSLGRARIFGRQTMGQALPAVTKRLATGDVLLYAIGDFVTSSGRSVEGTGVIPDISIPLSPGTLGAGLDEVMEAALRWIDGRPGEPLGR